MKPSAIALHSWLACALLCAGCNGEDLSLGELRCTGREIRCELPSDPVEGVTWEQARPLAQAHEAPASLLWTERLPCPADECQVQATRAVVHDDDSITVAVSYWSLGDDEQAGVAGVWLGRFDADGRRLWADGDSVRTDLDHIGYIGALAAELSLDAEDHAVLAISRPFEPFDGTHVLEVSRIAGDGALESLFAVDNAGSLRAFAAGREDYWLFADYTSRRELSRFDARGELVWRQTALGAPDPSPQPVSVERLEPLTGALLALDSQERAVLTFPGAAANQLARVDRNGNIEQVRRVRFSLGGPVLALDAQDRPLLGSVYSEPGLLGRVELASGDSTLVRFREHEQYYAPWSLAIQQDVDGRLLVATQDGPRSVPRLLIERIDDDLAQRATFAVDDAQQLLSEQDVEAGRGFAGIQGMGVAPAGQLYVWTTSSLARIDLDD